ncbi:unnamed protein product, partial [Iphiclides podalirius]
MKFFRKEISLGKRTRYVRRMDAAPWYESTYPPPRGVL